MPGPSTATESTIAIDLRQVSWMRPLAAAYAFDFSSVADWYAGDPTSADAWRAAIARTGRHRRRGQELAGIVEAQQARRGAPPASRAASARLADTRTVAVVTGQQAGLFGGPLYTLLKASTTVQLARRVAAEHGVQAVPVFWVEGDDHDWSEVRSVTVLDANLEPRDVTLPDLPGSGSLPISALVLDEQAPSAVDALLAVLPATDFTDWVGSILRGSYRPGQGMATAFATLLETLLGPHGLVVFESADPAAKPLVADLFARELQFAGRTAELASAAGADMHARGHDPQVSVQGGSIALFRQDGARRPIKSEDGELVAGDERFSAEALAAEVVAHPERFSPNVLLRPIVQDALFPTVSYVAGPSELAYLGQLRLVYEHFGVPMPLVHQRATATLVDAAAIRFLSRYDVPVDDLRAQDESTLNRLLRAQLPPEVEQALAAAETGLSAIMQQVIDAAPKVDPTLAGAARTTLGRMEHDLKGLHNKVIQAAKKRDETLRRQFSRTQAQIFPTGELQERVLGVPFFLNRYGPALIDRLLDELPLEMGRHWLIAI